ncbi:hypothetical protein GUITHDRAFT_150827 [Guillardia theta CCMP2712]|uniref:Uncharacterized protein n=1 Tax=Guillardia theta (strain CCMP2712) TaxID=905079 RepID=L1JU75_GUITC|nr:hypothetical protein GUITHDRAFT_150827 [Guillardia theta CCMP2712]EKX51844.1 hypothetical protein GUITHDRAFT_150827 [Guillardia theta CCMP2712]|eukprot:XP_005838824.1 hypothetical protein GUITHDRAFT_150827 [Guillardia theta CCMP2712]
MLAHLRGKHAVTLFDLTFQTRRRMLPRIHQAKLSLAALDEGCGIVPLDQGPSRRITKNQILKSACRATMVQF